MMLNDTTFGEPTVIGARDIGVGLKWQRTETANGRNSIGTKTLEWRDRNAGTEMLCTQNILYLTQEILMAFLVKVQYVL